MLLFLVLTYCVVPESRPVMASFLKPGMLLQGRLSSYSLLRDLYRSADDGVVYLAKYTSIVRRYINRLPDSKLRYIIEI